MKKDIFKFMANNFKGIITHTLTQISNEKRKFKIRKFKELSRHIYVEVQLNKRMYIDAKLNKSEKHFKNDLKRLIRAISDWAKNIKTF